MITLGKEFEMWTSATKKERFYTYRIDFDLSDTGVTSNVSEYETNKLSGEDAWRSIDCEMQTRGTGKLYLRLCADVIGERNLETLIDVLETFLELLKKRV